METKKLSTEITYNFLSKENCILEIKYEDTGVSEKEFNNMSEKLPEDITQFIIYFLKYLQSPIVKDDFLNYGERRKWGIEVLNKANYEAGLLYKSNKISRSNLRRLNSCFCILEYKKISDTDIFKRSKDLLQEMNDLIIDNDYYESLGFEEKKTVADKATEFARAVCIALIKEFK